LLILDFDGVINMRGSAGDARRYPDPLGYLTQANLECEGATYSVRFSRELVRRLNTAVWETHAEWLWLATWNECSLVEHRLWDRHHGEGPRRRTPR